MDMEEHKFSVQSWWAKSPDFVLAAIASQLDAAKAIWPELREWGLFQKKEKEEEPPASA